MSPTSFFLGVTLLLLALSEAKASASSSVQVLRRIKEVQPNTQCEKTKSCALVQASLDVEDYQVKFTDGTSFGTKAHISYKTKDLESLKDYVVVQWIRGCQFDSRLRDGQVVIRHDIARDFFGGTVPFIHPEWVIDSTDTDPVYNSAVDRGVPRHTYYRWNTVPGSFDKKTQRYYGFEKPTHPELYVRDMPSTAFTVPSKDGTVAKNLSMEFRSCIFKSSDVPEADDPSGKSFESRALMCFEWKSSFIYNFESRRFESPEGISEACL